MFTMVGVSFNHYGNCISGQTKDLCFIVFEIWKWININTNKLKHKTRSIESCQFECVPFTMKWLTANYVYYYYYWILLEPYSAIDSLSNHLIIMIYDLRRKDPNKMQFFCFVVKSHTFCPSNGLAFGQVINFSGVDTHTFAIISIPTHKNNAHARDTNPFQHRQSFYQMFIIIW